MEVRATFVGPGAKPTLLRFRPVDDPLQWIDLRFGTAFSKLIKGEVVMLEVPACPEHGEGWCECKERGIGVRTKENRKRRTVH